MSKKEELLWLADEFSKYAPGPFLKVWVWLRSTDVSALTDVINRWPGPLKIFGLPIPARLLGIPAEGDPWVRANCCLAWEGGPLEELFSRASKIISNGQDGRFELWTGVFVRAALESASPLVSFSRGPFVWTEHTEYDLRMVLDFRSGKEQECVPGLKEKLETFSTPWILYAEHRSPFLSSAALCRQLAQQEEAPASGSPAPPESDSQKQETLQGQFKINKARERFLNAIAKNLSGKRVEDVDQAAHLIAGNLPLNEKLQKIVELFPLMARFSSREWAEILGVTHTAIQNTNWWKQNRSGEKDRRIAEREDRLRERGKTTTQRELQGGNPD